LGTGQQLNLLLSGVRILTLLPPFPKETGKGDCRDRTAADNRKGQKDHQSYRKNVGHNFTFTALSTMPL
jgi:hypothetical protein